MLSGNVLMSYLNNKPVFSYALEAIFAAGDAKYPQIFPRIMEQAVFCGGTKFAIA